MESIEERLRSAYIKGVLDSAKIVEDSGERWVETTRKFHAPDHGPVIKSLATKIREALLTRVLEI